jgi:predicted DNA-binding transcriptional regulator YafY
MNACRRALRLLILMVLLEDRPYTSAELAVVLCVTRRTITKDLRDLQGEPLYYPLVCDRNRWRRMA